MKRGKTKFGKAPIGHYHCRMCGSVFPHGGNMKIVICLDCQNATILCLSCNEETNKYQPDSGDERNYCSRTCRVTSEAYRKAHSKKIRELHENGDEYRKKLSLSIKCALAAEEKTARRREIAKELWQRKDYQEKMSSAMRSVWSNPAHRDMMEKRRQEFMTEEYANKMAVMMRERWKNTEYSSRVMIGVEVRMQTGRKTDIEIMVEQALIQLDIKYKFNHRVYRYFIDFALLKYKLGIECDGEYWHRDKEKDARRDEILSAHGWQIIRLTGAEIKADVLSALSRKVLPLLHQ